MSVEEGTRKQKPSRSATSRFFLFPLKAVVSPFFSPPVFLHASSFLLLRLCPLEPNSAFLFSPAAATTATHDLLLPSLSPLPLALPANSVLMNGRPWRRGRGKKKRGGKRWIPPRSYLLLPLLPTTCMIRFSSSSEKYTSAAYRVVPSSRAWVAEKTSPIIRKGMSFSSSTSSTSSCLLSK